jgi:hypothetical protein
VDIIGDGVAETEFVIGSYTYKVDGIAFPRSTANFPGGESDLWDPTLFPDPS